jgi:peptidoglycan-associated lipoprotein
MNTIITVLATITLFLAGCSSTPVKEPAKEAPKAAVAPVPAAQTAPAVAPKITAQPVVKSPVAIDPLSDPNSPLAKRSVYYDFDSSEIRDEFKPLIQAHAGYLKAHSTTQVKVEGNCDERGSREYNLALGQKRAEAVKSALKLLGVTDDQVEAVSWGEERPAAPGHDESAWAKNRRSDIVYLRVRR